VNVNPAFATIAPVAKRERIRMATLDPMDHFAIERFRRFITKRNPP
jgi:hypothetical protein